MGYLEDLSPQKIMLAGDWHGQKFAVKEALTLAHTNNVDLIIQLGDFGLWHGQEGEQYINYITKNAQKVAIPILWIDGNHENFTKLYQKPLDPNTNLRHYSDYLIHLPRNTRWNWSGVTFHALGGATSLDRSNRTPNVNWWEEEAITSEQAKKATLMGTTDLLLLHDCPAGVEIPGIDKLSSLRIWPEPALRDAWAHRDLLLEICQSLKPKEIYHGHFHLRYSTIVDLHPEYSTKVTGLSDESTRVSANTVILVLSELAKSVKNN